jgi:putative NADPH-quinone reductase
MNGDESERKAEMQPLNEGKRVLLLVGSAKRPGQSTSQALGEYLLGRLAALGCSTEVRFAHQVMRSPERTSEFVREVQGSDVFVIAFPLYVDGLPALVIKALEAISAELGQGTPNRSAGSQSTGARGPRVLAIANSGFPEAAHNRFSLDCCRLFARQAGLEWAGGLPIGGGGALSGRLLEQAGGMAANLRKALELTAAALDRGEAATDEAVTLASRPMMPVSLYLMAGNAGWVLTARHNRALLRLRARPFVKGLSAARERTS